MKNIKHNLLLVLLCLPSTMALSHGAKEKECERQFMQCFLMGATVTFPPLMMYRAFTWIKSLENTSEVNALEGNVEEECTKTSPKKIDCSSYNHSAAVIAGLVLGSAANVSGYKFVFGDLKE